MQGKLKFSDNALTILEKRYLQPGETPEDMLQRASFGNSDYYEIMANLDFLPNSPVLFNAGLTEHGTFSACFFFEVHDTMESIMETARKAGMVMKWGGGVGYSFHELRPKGAIVKSTRGFACGPVAVIRYYNELAKLVTQGGKREGAQMGILSCRHPDIREFIHCKDLDPDGLSRFNLSVACTDEFMQKVVDNASSEESKLWQEIIESAWKTGDPGVYFIDTAERTNPTPWLGKLSGTNVCGEVPLLSDEGCNLGSINLSNFILGNKVDYARLEYTVRLATRYLNDVLDKNKFPEKTITKAVALTKKIGLGIMGWADILALLRIPYASDEAVDLASQVMSFIQSMAHNESEKLAEEKGVCPAFEDMENAPRRRNATVTCIAPTGTISILANCSSGIEPHFALEWERTMGDGTVIKERVSVLDRCGDFIPQVSHEIPWGWHVRHQAAFQKYVDLSISKTINLANNAVPDDISAAYIMMWKLGIKGGTVYRDGCRERQVLSTSSSTKPTLNPSDSRRRLPDERPSITHKFQVGDMEGYAIVGMYDDKKPGELFINVSKEGSTISGLMDALGILTSLSLQHGVPLESIVNKLSGVRFEPAGLTANPDIPIATSVVDYIFRWINQRFNENHQPSSRSGQICSDCGSHSVVYGEGCLFCSICGWSKCG